MARVPKVDFTATICSRPAAPVTPTPPMAATSIPSQASPPPPSLVGSAKLSPSIPPPHVYMSPSLCPSGSPSTPSYPPSSSVRFSPATPPSSYVLPLPHFASSMSPNTPLPTYPSNRSSVSVCDGREYVRALYGNGTSVATTAGPASSSSSGPAYPAPACGGGGAGAPFVPPALTTYRCNSCGGCPNPHVPSFATHDGSHHIIHHHHHSAAGGGVHNAIAPCLTGSSFTSVDVDALPGLPNLM